MTHTSMPPVGSVVTYCLPSEWRPFRRAVVSGPALLDPGSGVRWIPIESADGTETLIHPDAVVEVESPGRPGD